MDRKKAYIKTFGCQMNVYDSERMAEALQADGYEETGQREDADLIILNTCHIRDKAVEKVYSDLGRIRQVKAERAAAGLDTIIAVAGCVAQAEGREIIRRAPAVDVVIGPQNYHRLPDLLKERGSRPTGIVETDFPEEDKFARLPERGTPRASTAFLTVQEGCDKFCTFCVVPYTRGAEVSRPVIDLVKEARRLVERGAREITLLGQNVNAYHGLGEHGGTASLAGLVRALARIGGLKRVRYTTSHPRDMTDDLMDAHREEEKLMPYLHLPFQAGSDRILATMNRRHTAREYVDLIGRIRDARPDIALSTDIIVGFPGETEEDFQATLDLVDEIGFAHAYAFKYSARPGTPAARMEGQVPEPVKSERLGRLATALSRVQYAFNADFVGKRAPVLFERVGSHPGRIVGRSPHFQAVTARGGADLIGRIAEVAILEAQPNCLSGVIDLE